MTAGRVGKPDAQALDIPDLETGAVEAIVRGRHGDPFAVLGLHGGGD